MLDRFSDLFSRFSNRFSYRFKSFSGAVSFCRHAALTNRLKPAIRNFWPPEARFAKKGFGSGTLKRFARMIRANLRIDSRESGHLRCIHPDDLRGPAAILFISCDTCSDSISKTFLCLFFWGIAQLSRDTLQNGVSHGCACVKVSCKGGYRTILGECKPPLTSIAREGVSQRQCRSIARYGATKLMTRTQSPIVPLHSSPTFTVN